ncbi:hypothetical protein B0J11DRAFT_585600 [Dendryphion nanum]|uniref:Uncharacterized protein n=1 Tax=Dendryphion nanum TaxID=256645 RepID=A0A9P9D3P3_9PLEO|nr:hypothetical protein B0J11DRAFT_585600 [Dendryphion nanum]
MILSPHKMYSKYRMARDIKESDDDDLFHDLRVPGSRSQPFPSPSLALAEFGLNLVLPSPPDSPLLSAEDGEEGLELTRTITAIYSPVYTPISSDDGLTGAPIRPRPEVPPLVCTAPLSPTAEEDPALLSTSQCPTPRPQSTNLNTNYPQSLRSLSPIVPRYGPSSAPCVQESDHSSVNLLSSQPGAAELVVRTNKPHEKAAAHTTETIQEKVIAMASPALCDITALALAPHDPAMPVSDVPRECASTCAGTRSIV